MFQNFTIELPNIKIKQINYEVSYFEYLQMKSKMMKISLLWIGTKFKEDVKWQKF